MGADDDVYLPSSMRANKAAHPHLHLHLLKRIPFLGTATATRICYLLSARPNLNETIAVKLNGLGASPVKSAPRPYNEPATEPEHAQAQDENDDDYDDYGFDDFDVEEL